MTEKIKNPVNLLIKKYKINAVVFIPSTIRREVQLIKELEKSLNLSLHKIKISKIKTPVAVSQKTLSRLEDRIENVKNTFVVEEDGCYNNILLIDDAVGSGFTLNEIACQIKDRGVSKNKIIGWEKPRQSIIFLLA